MHLLACPLVAVRPVQVTDFLGLWRAGPCPWSFGLVSMCEDRGGSWARDPEETTQRLCLESALGTLQCWPGVACLASAAERDPAVWLVWHCVGAPV